MAVEDLSVEEEKIVQRRIKESLLKSSILIGAPRFLGSLAPIVREIKDDRIDTFAPR